MKRSILIIFLAVATSGFSQQKSAVRFLKRADKALQKLQSVSYVASYLFKSPTDVDTLGFNGKITYALNPRDVFFGYDLRCENENYFDAYYTLGKSYTFIHQDKKIYPKRFLDPKKVVIKKGPFLNSPSNNIFDEYFKNKAFISSMLSDNSLIFKKHKSHFCADTIHITAEYTKQNTDFFSDTIWDFKIDFYFDRKTKLPLLIQRAGLSDKGSYFSKISFTYQAINQDSIHDFFIGYRFPDDYELVEPKIKKKHGHQEKVIKTVAPNFSLFDAYGNRINLADLKGKVVLLDFWYSSCAPCIKASHYLEEYSKKYADSNFVILGMNPINGANKIIEHNIKWDVSYAGVVCNQEVKNKYEVSSYPSFILIDKQGMIVYRSSGFSPLLMNRIEKQIQKAVRE